MIGGTGRWRRAALAGGVVVALSATAMGGGWTEFGCFVDGPSAFCAPPFGEDKCPSLVIGGRSCGSSSIAPDGVGGFNARKHVILTCMIQNYMYDPVLGCVDNGVTEYSMPCVDQTGDTCVGGGGTS